MPVHYTRVQPVLYKPPVVATTTDYIAKVLSFGPLSYWPLNDVSGTTAVCQVNTARNGTYSGPALANDSTGPFNTVAPYFDGINDFVNVYSTSLSDNYNGSELTTMLWLKVFDSSVWSDGVLRRPLMLPRIILTDSLLLSKETTTNALKAMYKNGKNVVYTGASADWICAVTTVSASGDLLALYINGTQIGTANSLGTWSGGALNASFNVIGAGRNTGIEPFYGWLAHGAIWTRALSSPEVADVSTP